MGFVPSIQGLSQTPWTGGEIGQGSAAFKSAAGRARAFSPAGVETPEEALAYIQQLYQDGRTDELVGLLRGNPVFREAWQTLQQSAASASEATGGLAAALPDPAPIPEQSALTVTSPDQPPAGQLQTTSQNLTPAQVTATQGFSPEIQAAQTHLVPALKPSRPLAAGRRIYENQARYFAQEKASSHRISIRV
jgi:hypothetical protein